MKIQRTLSNVISLTIQDIVEKSRPNLNIEFLLPIPEIKVLIGQLIHDYIGKIFFEQGTTFYLKNRPYVRILTEEHIGELCDEILYDKTIYVYNVITLDGFGFSAELTESCIGEIIEEGSAKLLITSIGKSEKAIEQIKMSYPHSNIFQGN